MSFANSFEFTSKVTQLLAPGSHAAAADQKTAGVSLQGYHEAVFIMATDATLVAAHTFDAVLEGATIAANDPPLTGDYATVGYPDLSSDQDETAGDPVTLSADDTTTAELVMGRMRTEYIGDYARLSWTVVGASGVNGSLSVIRCGVNRSELADGLSALSWRF